MKRVWQHTCSRAAAMIPSWILTIAGDGPVGALSADGSLPLLPLPLLPLLPLPLPLLSLPPLPLVLAVLAGPVAPSGIAALEQTYPGKLISMAAGSSSVTKARGRRSEDPFKSGNSGCSYTVQKRAHGVKGLWHIKPRAGLRACSPLGRVADQHDKPEDNKERSGSCRDTCILAHAALLCDRAQFGGFWGPSLIRGLKGWKQAAHPLHHPNPTTLMD